MLLTESFEVNLGFDWSFGGKIASVRSFFGSYLDEWQGGMDGAIGGICMHLYL